MSATCSMSSSQQPEWGEGLKSGQVGRNEETSLAYIGEENPESPQGPVQVFFWIKD